MSHHLWLAPTGAVLTDTAAADYAAAADAADAATNNSLTVSNNLLLNGCY